MNLRFNRSLGMLALTGSLLAFAPGCTSQRATAPPTGALPVMSATGAILPRIVLPGAAESWVTRVEAPGNASSQLVVATASVRGAAGVTTSGINTPPTSNAPAKAARGRHLEVVSC